MKPEDLAEIDRFVHGFGRANLLEYFDLEASMPAERVDEALQAKRRWAQSQQANPKYKQEAIWLIKNQRLCRRALIDEPEQYIEHIRSEESRKQLELLAHFIEGATAGGKLTTRALQTIQEQALRMKLDLDQVEALVQEVLTSSGARRCTEPDPAFVDHYQVLGIHSDADLETIEQAYRSHYQQARLQQGSQDLFGSLDTAWDVLQSDKARQHFDALRTMNEAVSPGTIEQVESTSSLRGVPAAMHRSPGELERELAPASTDGIAFARLSPKDPQGEGLPGPEPAHVLRPASKARPQIRFVDAQSETDRPTQARPLPVESPSTPSSRATTRKRIPLSSRRGPSPMVIVALILLFAAITGLYWVMQG